jgi:hypothetical protein|tara:strand:- start:247 stop:1383 length:1137 start_codon:yes stop_codon:yes gene_type:complete
LDNYALVSSFNDLDENKYLKDFCDYQNISIEQIFEFNDYSNMLKKIRSNKISDLIISTPKAMDSNLLDFCKKIIELYNLNVEVKCASFDFPDPFQYALKVLSLPDENPLRLNKIKDSINKKASRGQVLGKIPFGYQKNPSGFYEINDSEAKIVREIFSLFYKSQNIKDIVNLLNEQKDFNKGKQWSSQGIEHILKNDFYLGVYRRYNNVIPNSHVPIIDRILFNECKMILGSKEKKIYKKNKYQGILFCGICKQKLLITSHTNYWNVRNVRTNKTYKYYSCPGKDNHTIHNKKTSINLEILHNVLKVRMDIHSLENQSKIKKSDIYRLVNSIGTGSIAMKEFVYNFKKYLNYLNSDKSLLNKKFYIYKEKEQIKILDH